MLLAPQLRGSIGLLALQTGMKPINRRVLSPVVRRAGCNARLRSSHVTSLSVLRVVSPVGFASRSGRLEGGPVSPNSLRDAWGVGAEYGPRSSRTCRVAEDYAVWKVVSVELDANCMLQSPPDLKFDRPSERGPCARRRRGGKGS